MAKLKPYIYAFLGIQGSGKGTQVEILKSKFNTPLAITGDILRAEVENNSDVGKKIKPIIESGNLISIDIWTQIMSDYLINQDLSNGLLLDGTPRTMEQVTALEKIIKNNHLPSIKVIHIALPKEVAIQRLLIRRICPIDKRSMINNICPEHNISTIIRKDDTEIAINRRIDLFFTETEPVINYYREQKAVISIDGNHSIEEVNKQIIAKLTAENLIND